MAKEGEGMHERERAVGEGPGVLLEGKQEKIRRRDLEGGGGGCRCHVGNSNVVVSTDGSRVAHLMLRDGA